MKYEVIKFTVYFIFDIHFIYLFVDHNNFSKGDPKYAQRIYDDMGEQFEGKLVTSLGYRGPWELYEMLKEILNNKNRNCTYGMSNVIHPVRSLLIGDHDNRNISDKEYIDDRASDNIVTCTKDDNHHDDKNITVVDTEFSSISIWRVLDLGCGSGLVGKVFQDLVTPVAGSNEIKYYRPNVETVQHEEKIEVEVEVEVEVEKINLKAMTEEVMEKETTSEDISKLTSDDLDRSTLKSLQKIFFEYHGSLMIGIDVSTKMVEISKRTNYYTSVARSDLSEALQLFEIDSNFTNIRHNIIPLNLIIAADTFIYVGALGSVFRQVKRCLSIHGFFLFSIEDLDRSPMRVKGKSNNESLKSGVSSHENASANSDKINQYHGDDKYRKVTEKKMEIGVGEEKREEIKPESNYYLLPDRIKHLKIIDFEPVGAVPGWGGELLKSARFAHSNSYIEILAHIHGFQIVKSKSVILRTEETIPLYGRLYVLESI